MLCIVENRYFDFRKLDCVINLVSKQLTIYNKLHCDNTIAKE